MITTVTLESRGIETVLMVPMVPFIFDVNFFEEPRRRALRKSFWDTSHFFKVDKALPFLLAKRFVLLIKLSLA